MDDQWTGGRVLRLALGVRGGDAALAALLFMGHQAGEALVPFIIGRAIDEAITTGDGGAMAMWIGILAVTFVCFSLSWRFGAKAMQRANQQATLEVRGLLAARILDHRGGAERGRLPGELLGISTTDAERTGWIVNIVGNTAGALIALAIAAIILLRVSLPLGLLVLVGLPPVLVLLNLLSRPLERRTANDQSRAARATGIATDLITGLRVLKGIGGERPGAARYRVASRDALGATVAAARIHGMYEGTTIILTGAFMAAVALVGGRLAAEGSITIGDLIAAVGLTQFLLGPFTRLAYSGADFARARVSAVRVANVLSSTAGVTDGTGPAPAPITGHLVLQGVTSGPLHALSLEAHPGELLGVVTTSTEAAALVDLLARSTSPEAGAITLDGSSIDEIRLSEYRQAVLVAPHDAVVFAGSLRDNVAVVATSDDAVEQAIAAAAAIEVVASVAADGLTTERGRSLSGGQRQRLVLARALAAAAPILVLNDPTTAVDAATEAQIASLLQALRSGRTSILVTTSPALLAVADRVAFLDDGALRIGTHDSLMRSEPRYRETVA